MSKKTRKKPVVSSVLVTDFDLPFGWEKGLAKIAMRTPDGPLTLLLPPEVLFLGVRRARELIGGGAVLPFGGRDAREH